MIANNETVKGRGEAPSPLFTKLPRRSVLGSRVARGSRFGDCPDGQRKRTPAVGTSEEPTAGVPRFCRERVTGVQAGQATPPAGETPPPSTPLPPPPPR